MLFLHRVAISAPLAVACYSSNLPQSWNEQTKHSRKTATRTNVAGRGLSRLEQRVTRANLAHDLAAGLAGWLQLQAAQRLAGLSGEDSARLIAAQIVNAQGKYAPATSQLPSNWGSTKKRVDIALKGRSAGAQVWYGAIEIKWPGIAFDVGKTREQIVQDAMRLTFISTSLLNAHFLVLGGSLASMKRLFDEPHPNASKQEKRRKFFKRLFSRNLKKPLSEASYDEWSKFFPQAGARIPKGIFGNFQGKLKTELLDRVTTKAGDTRGRVYVWQCNRTRGPAI